MSPIYRLFVCVGGHWQLECAIESGDAERAFSEALRLVKPDHAHRPLRFEIDSNECRATNAK